MSIGQSGVGPQGLSQAALELLANPEKLKKTHASLKEAQKQAQDAIELAGPAQEIIQIRADVEGELDKQRAATEAAERVLEERIGEAEAKAQDIVSEAVEKANGLVAEGEKAKVKAQQEADSERHRIKSEKHQLDKMREQLTRGQDQLDEVRAALDKREAELDARSADLDDLNRSLLEEKAKLASLREQIASTVG